MRRAAILLAACLAAPAVAQENVTVTGAGPNCVGSIDAAHYEGPTTRYAHGVLGDAVEWERLTVTVGSNGTCAWGTSQMSVTLPDHRVFEDTEPRLADLDGDGMNEVITVESSVKLGARVTVWGVRDGEFGRVATTPFIGQRNRWLAPVGAADLDGDGYVEIAYVDRPHLARTLRVWRFQGGKLTEVASNPGLTNHRIGQDFISGGIRDCGQGPEMITVDGNWSRVVASRFSDGRIASRDIGPFRGQGDLKKALSCR
ncbi:FG-GAP repeat domain-containing protein [Shimia biformata]|uniref:FG-GAP repeat domain-containing protein n=1 Tax=Shimia biformata TaxID=1294299 RepID=UPI001950028A|nr:VCBS repeat-containing protein [Shimia biformata]